LLKNSAIRREKERQQEERPRQIQNKATVGSEANKIYKGKDGFEGGRHL